MEELAWQNVVFYWVIV